MKDFIVMTIFFIMLMSPVILMINSIIGDMYKDKKIHKKSDIDYKGDE